MATAGAGKNYRAGGEKFRWRRTVINEVLSRTRGRERTGFVLYLAGPQDNDREVLIAKGVPRDNLLAIDRSCANISAMRDRANYGVVGDALDVLGSWPEDRQVAAILLDFCCGLETRLFKLFSLLFRPCFHETVVMVNLQRGRDPSSNGFRQKTVELHLDVAEPRNRAMLLLRGVSVAALGCLLQSDHDYFSGGFIDGISRNSRAEIQSATVEYVQGIEAMYAPKYLSYTSPEGLTFDSVVFTALACESGDSCASIEPFDSVLVRRRLSAQFAMRTMKKRRSFPSH